MTGALTQHRDQGILVLTIDRPRAANAIDAEVSAAFCAAMVEAAGDPAISGVLVTGSGARVFSAGADLKNPDGLPAAELTERRARSLSAMLDAILDFGKPLVAAVNGVAAGAGAMIALLSDEIVAADTARFVFPEIDVGIPTLLGLGILTEIGGSRLAADLILSGRSLSAEEAGRRGLVRCVPAVELMGAAMEAARMLAGKPGSAYALNKAWLNQARRAVISAAIEQTRINRAKEG